MKSHIHCSYSYKMPEEGWIYSKNCLSCLVIQNVHYVKCNVLFVITNSHNWIIWQLIFKASKLIDERGNIVNHEFYSSRTLLGEWGMYDQTGYWILWFNLTFSVAHILASLQLQIPLIRLLAHTSVTSHIVEWVVQMAIILLLSAAS